MSIDVDKLIQQIRSLPPEEQKRMRDALDKAMAAETAEQGRPADEEFQRRLVEAGLLKEIRPRRRDQQAFEHYQPVEIAGKPLSETIIEERR